MPKHTTTKSGSAIPAHTTTPQSEGVSPSQSPQTYEQWKRQHGYQPPESPRLEIGQRVKSCELLDNEDECDDDFYEWQDDYPEYEYPGCEAEYVDQGTLGTVQAFHDHEKHTYEIRFDNGVVFWCTYLPYEEDEWNEIIPHGKSPSQLAREKAEAERLAQWQQLSLFDAAPRESEGGK